MVRTMVLNQQKRARERERERKRERERCIEMFCKQNFENKNNSFLGNNRSCSLNS